MSLVLITNAATPEYCRDASLSMMAEALPCLACCSDAGVLCLVRWADVELPGAPLMPSDADSAAAIDAIISNSSAFASAGLALVGGRAGRQGCACAVPMRPQHCPLHVFCTHAHGPHQRQHRGQQVIYIRQFHCEAPRPLCIPSMSSCSEPACSQLGNRHRPYTCAASGI